MINLRGFLKEYKSQWNRLTIHILNEDEDEFTYKFLEDKYFSSSGIENCPIELDKSQFYVKVKSKYFLEAYSNSICEKKITLFDLIDKKVNLNLEIKYYNYKGRKGWYFILKRIYKIN